MGAAESSSLAVLTNIVTAPSQAYAAIKERPTVWLPLLLLIVSYCVVAFVYTNRVDLEWLIDQQLANARNLTDAQREQAVKAAMRLPPAVYGGISAVSSTIFIAGFLALTALYYRGISFATGDGIKYKQWFSLASWCTIPVVFGIIASLVHVLSGDARFMSQEELNPFAFGNLLGIDRSQAPIVQRVLLGLDFTALWGLALSVLGYQTFAKRSLAVSAAIVLAPVVLIVGGVVALIASR
jgi:Yip1 domain